MERAMQAMLSSTASGEWRRDERIAALPYISQQLGVNPEATPRRRKEDRVEEERGAGVGLQEDAGELLSLLHLSSTMLSLKGSLVQESPSVRTELTYLLDRSWQLLERLVEVGAGSGPSQDPSPETLFLKGQVFSGARRGPTSESEDRAGAGGC